MVKNLRVSFTIYLIWLLISLILLLIGALLTYFNIVNASGKSIFILIYGIIIFMVLGFLSGNIKANKGLLNGIIFSSFVIIILLLLNFLGYENKITFENIVRFVILIASSGLGGIIGVNFRPIVKRD